MKDVLICKFSKVNSNVYMYYIKNIQIALIEESHVYINKYYNDIYKLYTFARKNKKPVASLYILHTYTHLHVCVYKNTLIKKKTSFRTTTHRPRAMDQGIS